MFAALLRKGPFNGDQLAQFTHQLATLMGAGQPLDRALGILLDLPEGERARKLVERVRERVRGGSTLSQALDEENGVFPRLYVSLVRAGEAGGALDVTLRRLAEYLERAQALRSSVINALIYPAFLLVGVLGSLLLLLTYVVPQFVPVFQDMNVPIPLITRVVLGIGTVMQDGWWMMLLLVVGGFFFVRMRLRDADTPARFRCLETAHARVRSAAAEDRDRAHRAHPGHAAQQRRADAGRAYHHPPGHAQHRAGNRADARRRAGQGRRRPGRGAGRIEAVPAPGPADGAGRRGGRGHRRACC